MTEVVKDAKTPRPARGVSDGQALWWTRCDVYCRRQAVNQIRLTLVVETRKPRALAQGFSTLSWPRKAAWNVRDVSEGSRAAHL
jgi:hypothetical protein